MKYQDYIAHVEEAKGYSSAREFLAEYGFPADCPYTAEGVIKFCNIIFAAAHQDLGALANISGASRDAFARSRGIPQRSYSNWTYGRTKAPDYIAELIGYSMLEDLPKEEEEEE